VGKGVAADFSYLFYSSFVMAGAVARSHDWKSFKGIVYQDFFSYLSLEQCCGAGAARRQISWVEPELQFTAAPALAHG
jgi:hypothetical protein